MKNKLTRHLVLVGLLLWGWCALLADQALAVESAYASSVEYEVKTAFIHNFTKFIDWSRDSFKSKNSPIRIGILGKGPINDPLLKLNGKKSQQRSLEVSRVDNLNKVNEYHIIFINHSEKGRVRSFLRNLRDTGILTIGDMTGFAEHCGIINFYLQGGKVRFEINVEASNREKLQISSKLLRLARIVNTQCD